MLRSFLVFQLLLLPLAATAWFLQRSGGGRGALRGMRTLLILAVMASLGLGLLSPAPSPQGPRSAEPTALQSDLLLGSPLAAPMAPADPTGPSSCCHWLE
ncbi:MAG: hypothetical protein ACI9VR_003214 [Cognaticolwellia sp.]|jgi:hypothetical protein